MFTSLIWSSLTFNVNSIVNYMASRLKNTRNEATYFYACDLFIVYFRLLICNKSNMRI